MQILQWRGVCWLVDHGHDVDVIWTHDTEPAPLASRRAAINQMNPDLLEIVLLLITTSLALACRPWRMFWTANETSTGTQTRTQSETQTGGPDLFTPTLACLVILPVLWSLPRAHEVAVQLPWSGAVLVLLMLGWPLAILVFPIVGLISMLWVPVSAGALLDQVVWQGVVPATLALALGAGLRRWLGPNPFVYILGRGFLGTVISLFVSSLIALALGRAGPPTSDPTNSLVALWLMAWADAFVTGMFTAIFVSFRPQWLATWSDTLYLQRH